MALAVIFVREVSENGGKDKDMRAKKLTLYHPEACNL